MDRRAALSAVALLLSIVATAEPSYAQSRPATKWCLRGPTGGNACLYHTLDQCRTAAFGTGGSCMRNPRYGQPPRRR